MPEGLEPDDYAEFIRRVRQGDEQAAEQLVRRYEPEIRMEIRTRLRLRGQRLRSLFDSLDVCQSVMASFFVRAAVGEFDLEDPRQLIRLLVGMARNKLADRVRHHHRQVRDVRRVEAVSALDQATTEGAETPSQIASARELLALFRERLSAEELRVADLRALGHGWDEVAAELGGTPDARRKQLARAVARVGQDLGIDTLSA